MDIMDWMKDLASGVAIRRIKADGTQERVDPADFYAPPPETEGWQYVFYAGVGPNPNCKHDAEYEFRRGEDGWIGRLADQHPAFNIAGGLMFRPLPSDVVIDG